MLFFRSEEMLNRWLDSKNAVRGAVLSLAALWDLSQHWYRERMSPAYRGRAPGQVRKIFEEAGLTSEYWQAG
jgi:hypothetical protein